MTSDLDLVTSPLRISSPQLEDEGAMPSPQHPARCSVACDRRFDLSLEVVSIHTFSPTSFGKERLPSHLLIKGILLDYLGKCSLQQQVRSGRDEYFSDTVTLV